MARILLVEDDMQLRELLRAMLEHLGHAVVEAADGRDALQLVDSSEQGSFDLIVTDILMPEIDGLEVLSELRKSAPWIKSMAISGSGQNSIGLLPVAEHLGAQLTLKKPFAVEDFHQAVDLVLSS